MKLTANGLVFIEIPEFNQVPFKHLVTSLDDDQSDSQFDCGRAASITGYTEWLSETVPPLTIGWDWVIDASGQGSIPWRLGPPRTNVNLVDNDGQALHWEASLEQLGQWIDAQLPRQQTVDAIGLHPMAQQAAQSSLN